MSEEKTGGTPHGGRLAPGKEGKGKCRRQRVPELAVELKGELKKLYDQALAVADYMGHEDVILWRIEKPADGKTADCGQIRCQRCKRVAGFALNPMCETIYVNTSQGPRVQKKVQKEKINGQLVEERCSG